MLMRAISGGVGGNCIAGHVGTYLPGQNMPSRTALG